MMSPNILASDFYLIALIFQGLALVFAIRIVRRVAASLIAECFLLGAFLISALREVDRLVALLGGAEADALDPFLTLIMSLSLFMGLQGLDRSVTAMGIQSERYEMFSKIDSLTGALRRHEIFDRFEQEISRAFRSQQPLAVIMFDIDLFKFVNDRYGHAVGDTVLSHLSHYCKTLLREIDILGRAGGEEFLVLLPNTSAEEAFIAAERLRQGVQEHPMVEVDRAPLKITISCGIAVLNPLEEMDLIHPILADKYYKEADFAMYEAKQKGRNRSILYTHELANV